MSAAPQQTQAQEFHDALAAQIKTTEAKCSKTARELARLSARARTREAIILAGKAPADNRIPAEYWTGQANAADILAMKLLSQRQLTLLDHLAALYVRRNLGRPWGQLIY